MKKYNIYLVICLIIGLIFVGINSVDASLPTLGKVIVIDPGHGGTDPGTVYGKNYEKDVNLAISLELEKSLTRNGASVLLTREGDYDLSSPNAYLRKKSDFDNRIEFINNSNADYYVSIHINYLNDSRYKGIQVFYLDDDDKERAEIVQTKLNELLNSDREVKKMSDYYMYDKLEVEGLLIECGFFSNPSERNLLISSEYQKKVADAIASSLSLIL